MLRGCFVNFESGQTVSVVLSNVESCCVGFDNHSQHRWVGACAKRLNTQFKYGRELRRHSRPDLNRQTEKKNGFNIRSQSFRTTPQQSVAWSCVKCCGCLTGTFETLTLILSLLLNYKFFIIAKATQLLLARAFHPGEQWILGSPYSDEWPTLCQPSWERCCLFIIIQMNIVDTILLVKFPSLCIFTNSFRCTNNIYVTFLEQGFQ